MDSKYGDDNFSVIISCRGDWEPRYVAHLAGIVGDTLLPLCHEVVWAQLLLDPSHPWSTKCRTSETSYLTNNIFQVKISFIFGSYIFTLIFFVTENVFEMNFVEHLKKLLDFISKRRLKY
jgi:hypothetical protein